MFRSAPRLATMAGLSLAIAAAGIVTPADAAVVQGSQNFKMLSGLTRVRNCVLADLNSQAVANWQITIGGATAVNFGSPGQSCVSMFTVGMGATASANLSYQTSAGAVLKTLSVPCKDISLVLPTRCDFPAASAYSNVALAKVVVSLTQTNPAAPPSTTTLLRPASASDSDSFKMLSGLSRIRNCVVADLQSQAKADWTFRSTGQNSVKLSGAGNVCMSLFRPGNSAARAVVTYQSAAGAALATATVNCTDTAIALPVHCPFPTSTDKTIVGLAKVKIDFTQTSPAAGTSSITLDLGD